MNECLNGVHAQGYGKRLDDRVAKKTLTVPRSATRNRTDGLQFRRHGEQEGTECKKVANRRRGRGGDFGPSPSRALVMRKMGII